MKPILQEIKARDFHQNNSEGRGYVYGGLIGSRFCGASFLVCAGSWRSENESDGDALDEDEVVEKVLSVCGVHVAHASG